MCDLINKITAFFIIVSLAAFPVHASDSLTIVRGQDYPPYHYLDENGIEQGFVIEIVKGAAQLMDIPITIKQYPWSRCINMMKKGYADAMMNLFKTDERETFMYFSDTILGYETNSLFILNTFDFEYTGSLDALLSLKIGVIRNYSYGKEFDATQFPLKYEFDTEKELINSLLNKRCQIIVGNRLTLQILFSNIGIKDKIRILDPDISKDPLYISFSKKRGHKKLSKAFSIELERFKTSEAYKKLMQKYSITLP